ncbi:MAG: hypothetical protein ACI9EF_000852 [Pseudohongiellaceae bacterium]|jgi:hypothetical protein
MMNPENMQKLLEELSAGQQRLNAQLASGRRRSALLISLLVLGLSAAGVLWFDHVESVPIVLPNQSRELDREELAAEIEELNLQLRNVRLERNQHLSETLQLRQQLIEKDRRLSELTSGLGQLASRAVPEAVPGVTVSATETRDLTQNPAHGVALALIASGLRDLSIVEHGAIENGVLFDVLVSRNDAQGLPMHAERFDRAHLQVSAGVVELVLERAASLEGDEALVERISMPDADVEAWASAGLQIDRGMITVAQASEALRAVLVGQSIELYTLGGYDEGRFVDLVLIEKDNRNVVQRTWSAAAASLLPVGPALLLEGGFLEEADKARPFWNGRARLVLEGAPYGAFQDTLRQLTQGPPSRRD